jgi:hypothetical protein
MRLGRGHAALAVVLSCAAVETCVFPTERDESVHVTIDPLPVLIRSNDASATARAWQIMAAGDSQPLANVTFVWSSDDPSIATVDATGHVVGIKSGTTMIRARAANFDRQSLPGQIALRVSNSLEIDSIRPADTVRYGELVTVYGVGLLDTLGIALSIGEGVLFPVPFSDTLRANGASQKTYWVPPPAHTAPLSYIAFGAGVFGSTIDTVSVLRRDLYEPNEIAPALINLDTSRPFPGTVYDVLLFLNPALAFEQLLRDQVEGVEWYRLGQTAPRDLTIVVTSDVPGTFRTFLTDSLRFQASDTSYRIGPDSWTFGPRSHACHGAAFEPKEAPSESTVVALKDFPGALHAIAFYTQVGRYALTVVEDYLVAGKGINRDSHEEDDYCNAVDPLMRQSALPFVDATLTIDNPHDVDWFRFSFPGGSFQARTTAPASASSDEPSDIDVYLLRIPSAGQTAMTVEASSTSPRSDENISYSALFPLAAGQYYLVVLDFAGVPTRYSLCFASPSCTPPPVLPAPSAAEVEASATRRARLEAAIARRSPRSPALRVPSRWR